MKKFTYHFGVQHRPLMQIEVKTTEIRRSELKKRGQSVNGPIRLPVTALLDTGASMTTLDEEIVDRLKLEPNGHEHFFSNGDLQSEPTECYWAGIIIPPTIEFRRLENAETPEEKMFESIRIAKGRLKLDKHGFQALIGMDILKHAVLNYDGPKGVFSLNFDCDFSSIKLAASENH